MPGTAFGETNKTARHERKRPLTNSKASWLSNSFLRRFSCVRGNAPETGALSNSRLIRQLYERYLSRQTVIKRHIERQINFMVQPTSLSRGHVKMFLGVMSLLALLALTLSACGGSTSSGASTSSSSGAATSANPSGMVVYIDEHEGSLNGQDDPSLDKFWFASSKTDQTFSTSYSANLAPGGTLQVFNEGDDPQKVTVTGPNNYTTSATIASGPDTSITIHLPATKGDYSVISDPANTPVRPGARGGTIHIG
jgi:hypothetical protein